MTIPDLMARNFITEMPRLPHLPSPSERPPKGNSPALRGHCYTFLYPSPRCGAGILWLIGLQICWHRTPLF